MQTVDINQLLSLTTHSWDNRLVKRIAIMVVTEAMHKFEIWVIFMKVSLCTATTEYLTW